MGVSFLEVFQLLFLDFFFIWVAGFLNVPVVMGLVSIVLEILEGPSIGAVVLELAVLVVPIWVALFVGVLVGWVWRPKWANLAAAVSVGSEESSTSSDPGRESNSASTISGQTLSPPTPAFSERTGDGKSSSEPPATISNDRLINLSSLNLSPSRISKSDAFDVLVTFMNNIGFLKMLNPIVVLWQLDEGGK